MLFNSQSFLLLFLPIALRVHALTSVHRPTWVVAILVLSCFFYAAWDVRLLPLLLGSIVLNWGMAQAFGASGDRRWLTAGILLNLLTLGIFKYANFILENLALFTGQPAWSLALILPLGVSFFTFQQIAYLVDLSRGTAKPHGLLRYALYVSFFPHLIAGPLLRHSEFFASLDRPLKRERLARLFGQGLVLVAIGLAKKVMMADPIAFAVDQLFIQAGSTSLGLGASWMAALGFSLQIYFDFSGYSDIAIGLGLLFGIVIPFNFDAPYRSKSIIEFWRRWHMTLSRLLRDYVYVPLGGSRHGMPRQVAALLATMLIGGFWHGAGWNFVVWGGLHGVALAANHLRQKASGAAGGEAPPLMAALAWPMTFLFVVATFVIFRADGIAPAVSILSGMAGLNGGSWAVSLVDQGWRPPLFGSIQGETLAIMALSLVVALAGPTSQDFAQQRLRPGLLAAILTGLVLVAAIVAVGGGGGTEFVYFQF